VGTFQIEDDGHGLCKPCEDRYADQARDDRGKWSPERLQPLAEIHESYPEKHGIDDRDEAQD
jgi:hypothetical protein